jgi:hypothetical protein
VCFQIAAMLKGCITHFTFYIAHIRMGQLMFFQASDRIQTQTALITLVILFAVYQEMAFVGDGVGKKFVTFCAG